MNIQFHKMHGLGNDFVIVDARDGVELSQGQVRHLADRRLGVGCDQVIVLRRAARADIGMDIFNSDGSGAGACGNGTRCAARLVMEWTGSSACTIETPAGILQCRDRGGDVEVDMGAPGLGWTEIPLANKADTVHLAVHPDLPLACAVSMGNPHAVFFVEDVGTLDIQTHGPAVETDSLFPERVNVEFAQVLTSNRIRMRVWERGAGITPACGTGACATLVAAVRRGLTDRQAAIELDGGELQIVWDETSGRVLMTGPATYAYCGRIDL